MTRFFSFTCLIWNGCRSGSLPRWLDAPACSLVKSADMSRLPHASDMRPCVSKPLPWQRGRRLLGGASSILNVGELRVAGDGRLERMLDFRASAGAFAFGKLFYRLENTMLDEEAP